MGLSMIGGAHIHPLDGWSQAARIGDTVFVSGQVPLDEQGRTVGAGDIRAQCEQVFRNLAAVLRSAGSSLELVAKLTVFATSRDYRPTYAEVRAAVFGSRAHFPASTFLVVSGLANPAWLIEVEAVAAVAEAASTGGAG